MHIHQSLKVTPAMEASITNDIWNWDNLLNFLHSHLIYLLNLLESTLFKPHE